MDKEVFRKLIKDPVNNAKWLRYGYKSRLGLAKSTADFGTDEGIDPWLFKYLDGIYMNVVQNGPLVRDFVKASDEDGAPRRMIPIIFCHGLTCSRTSYSGLCRDFASHGYFVISLDHYDGSCYYTRKKNGDEKFWSSMHDPKDRELRDKQLEVRVSEVVHLIDEMHQTDYLQEVCGFEPSVGLDLDHLILGGHSFGAATALAVSQQDERVKAMFGLDDWIWCLVEGIRDGKFTLTQPQFHLVTQGFPPIVEDWFDYNTVDELKRLTLNSSRPRQSELILFKHTNHYHQCDGIVIVPLESFIKSENRIQTNFVELYLSNSRAVLRWLHENGLSYPSTDMKKINKFLNDIKEEGYFEHIITAQSQNEEDLEEITPGACVAKGKQPNTQDENDSEEVSSLLTNRE